MNSGLKADGVATPDDCSEAAQIFQEHCKIQRRNERQRRYRKRKREKGEANETAKSDLMEQNQRLRDVIKELEVFVLLSLMLLMERVLVIRPN